MDNIRLEILRSLSQIPMRPNQLACDLWLRLDQGRGPNPFKTSEYIPIRSTLNGMLKDGSVVKLRRGVYALSEDSRYELFRDSMMALCTNEPEDTAFVAASDGAAPSGWR